MPLRSKIRKKGPAQNLRAAEKSLREFLFHLGRNPKQTDLRQTPHRVVKAWSRELLDGYAIDPAVCFKHTFKTGAPGLVVLRDLDFHSMCPHHLLPCAGTVDLAYESSGRVAGFSSVAKAVRALSHRLVLQEELGLSLVQVIMQALKARGAVCRIRSQQTCLSLIGERQGHAHVETWSALGSLQGRAGRELLALAPGSAARRHMAR